MRTCNGCQDDDDEVYEQFSLGIFAGYWHDECFKESGYRQEGPEGFDPMDAGEHYEPEDY